MSRTITIRKSKLQIRKEYLSKGHQNLVVQYNREERHVSICFI